MEAEAAAARRERELANSGLSLWMTATFQDGARAVVYRGDKDLSHYTYELCDGSSQKIDLTGGPATIYVVGPFDSPIRWINFKAGRDHDGRTFQGSSCSLDEPPLPPAPPIDGDPCPADTPVRGWSDTNYLYSIKLGSCDGNWVNLWYEPYVTTSFGNATTTYTIGHGFGEIELRNGTRVKWNTNPLNNSAIWWMNVTRPDGRSATVVDKSYTAGPGQSTDTPLPMNDGELWEFARRLRACAGPLNAPLSCRPGATGTPTASLVLTPPMYAGQMGTATLWTPQDSHRSAYVFATLDGTDCGATAAQQHGQPGTTVLDASPLASDLVEIPFVLRTGGRYLVCAYVADRSDSIPVSIERGEMTIASPRQTLTLEASGVGGGIEFKATATSTIARNLYVTVRADGSSCLFDVNTEQQSRATVWERAMGITTGSAIVEQTYAAMTGRRYLICAWLVETPFERPDLLESRIVTPLDPVLDARVSASARPGYSQVSATNASNVAATMSIAFPAAGVPCPSSGSQARSSVAIGATARWSVPTPTTTDRRACVFLVAAGARRTVEATWRSTGGALSVSITADGSTRLIGTRESFDTTTTAGDAGLDLAVWSGDCTSGSWGAARTPVAAGTNVAARLVTIHPSGMICAELTDTTTTTVLARASASVPVRQPSFTMTASVPASLSGSATVTLSGSTDVAGVLAVEECGSRWGGVWSSGRSIAAGTLAAPVSVTLSSWTSVARTVSLCAVLRIDGTLIASMAIGSTSIEPLSTSLRLETRSTPVVGSLLDVAVVGSSASWFTATVGIEERQCGGEPGAWSSDVSVSSGTVVATTRVRVPSATASWLCAYVETGNEDAPYALVASGRFGAIAPEHAVTVSLPDTAVAETEAVATLAVTGNSAASIVLRRGATIDCATEAAPGAPGVVATVAVASGASTHLVRIPTGVELGTVRVCANVRIPMANGTTFDRPVAGTTMVVEAPPAPAPTPVTDPGSDPSPEPQPDPTAEPDPAPVSEPVEPAPVADEPVDPAPPAPADELPPGQGGPAPGPWAPEPSGTGDAITVTAGVASPGRIRAHAAVTIDMGMRVEFVALRRAPHCSPTLADARARSNSTVLGSSAVTTATTSVTAESAVPSSGAWRVCGYVVDGAETTLVLGGVALDVPRR